jgi:hypothetical protein
VGTFMCSITMAPVQLCEVPGGVLHSPSEGAWRAAFSPTYVPPCRAFPPPASRSLGGVWEREGRRMGQGGARGVKPRINSHERRRLLGG